MNDGARPLRRIGPALVVLLSATAVWAQGRAVRKPLQAAPGVPGASATASAAASVPTGAPAGSAGRENKAEARLARLLPVSGGWTAEQVGQRARGVSYDVAAKNEALRAAAARVDQAMVAFVPRVSGTARYTRLSRITPPSLGGGGGYSVAVPGLPGVLPGQPIPAGTPLIASPPFSFPVILDQYTLQASVVVPISDYFTRISHNYAAASHNEEATRLDRVAGEAKALSDGKLTFYNWVKALGQREILQQALEATRERVKDAEALFKAGQVSKADVLGAQAQVAQGELSVAQADEYVRVAEEQLRLQVKAKPTEVVTLGEDVIEPLPRLSTDAEALRQEAISNRAELRSMAESEKSLSRVSSLSRAAAWPQISAVGNYTYANPNQRFVPQKKEWNGTWDVSLQLTWSPNDLFTGSAAGAEADANTAKLRAQRSQVRDGILLEVTQAIVGMQTADISAETALVGLAAAEEAYRVRHEMYRVGRATSVELTEAESSLFRAKLVAVSARIDQRIARVKLEHASGRDLARLK